MLLPFALTPPDLQTLRFAGVIAVVVIGYWVFLRSPRSAPSRSTWPWVIAAGVLLVALFWLQGHAAETTDVAPAADTSSDYSLIAPVLIGWALFAGVWRMLARTQRIRRRRAPITVVDSNPRRESPISRRWGNPGTDARAHHPNRRSSSRPHTAATR